MVPILVQIVVSLRTGARPHDPHPSSPLGFLERTPERWLDGAMPRTGQPRVMLHALGYRTMD
jgi:hypothetical protein